MAENNIAEKNIAVIGAGPVGSIAAAYLARRPDVKVTVIEPYYLAHMRKIASSGISLKNDESNDNGNNHNNDNSNGESSDVSNDDSNDKSTPPLEEGFAPVNAVFSLSELQVTPNIIIIATKAFTLDDVVTQLKKRFNSEERKNITFVCMQNGYGNEMFLSEALETNACRIAVNYVGNITAPGEVSGHWLKSPNYIGAAYPHIDNKAKELADMLNYTGLYTEFTEDIRPAAFLKTILNAALSPVCAATKKTMLEAMDDEKLCKIVRQTLIEGLSVAEDMGFKYKLKYDNGHPDVSNLMSYLRTGGNHPSSMRLDLLRGDKTEIEWINGAIIKEAKKLGIKTPYNTHLFEIVTSLEKSASCAREMMYKGLV